MLIPRSDQRSGVYRFSFAANLLALLLCLLSLTVKAGTSDPVCHTSLNVTINPDLCYVHIIPLQILIGEYSAEDYLIQIVDAEGLTLGDTIPGHYAGQTVSAQALRQDGSFVCSTQISLYDEAPPRLTLPPDVALRCDESPHPNRTGKAQAMDCLPVSISYEDEWIESLCSVPKVLIIRTWTAADAQGLISRDTQFITISRAAPEQILFPPDVEIDCADYLADPSLIQPLADKAGLPALVENPRCGLIYSHQDQRLDLCGDPQTSFVIVRRWTLLDACGSTLYTEDAAGQDNIQIIRVIDKTPPQIEPVPATLVADQVKETTGLATCSSTGFIPPPIIADDCNDFTVRILTTAGELEYANGVDGKDGGYIPFPGLPLGGPHQIYYEATDACGNRMEESIYLNVIDQSTPILLCDQQITVGLSSSGRGVILPGMIDRGTRDDCCLDRMQIKYESEPQTAFRDQIELYCENEPEMVVLRAWDCAGNYNDCTSRVRVQDPVPASIVSVPPTHLDVDCNSETQIYYDPRYLAPGFGDNCPVDLQFSVRDSLTECGAFGLYREWTVQDHPDHEVLQVGQWVRFIDQAPPVVNIVFPAPVCDTDGDCEERLSLDIIATDNCDADITIQSFLVQADGSTVTDPYGQVTVSAGGFNLSGNYPIGRHSIEIAAVDACGNRRVVPITYEVLDCTPPALVCPAQRSYLIENDEPVILTPSDLIDEWTEPCQTPDFEFTTSNTPQLVFGCQQVGTYTIGIRATDQSGNQSACSLRVEIQPGDRSCLPVGSVSGRIVTETGLGVGRVSLALNGIDTFYTTTDLSGNFHFSRIPAGEEYELIPNKQINAVNGVSTFDLVLISKHILGVDPLDSPYKILAADVNKSGTVSTLDLILARQVILSITDFFYGHRDTWRFVPADYTFQDPKRPLNERLPERLYLQVMEGEIKVNFIGIKLGDINDSVKPDQ